MTDTAVPDQLDIPGDDGRHRLGATRVANEVVAQIAALTALEVSGVHALYHATGNQGQLDRILRRSGAQRGVRVELMDDDTLRLDLYVVMEAGVDLPRMGAEVQRKVADAIDRMLGLGLREVNIFVSEVAFS
jgi:uncharacterized alkaline shock family protein YloU